MRLLLLLLLLTFCCTCGRAPDKASSAVTEIPEKAVYQNLSPTEFAERIGGDNTVLLDVRTPGEIARGKITGAVEMDFRAADFEEQLQQLDPSKTYLVYCASGGRSAKSCERLNALGATKVYNLKGGYSAWMQ